MKRILFCFLALFFALPLFSQRWKTFSKWSKTAWQTAENILTAKEIYDWVNEDRYTTNQYLNPNGTWKSTSGAIFYVAANQGGFSYQNANNRAVYSPAWSGTMNFYYLDFYNGWQFLHRYYYSVVDRNTIIVNSTTGEEFVWKRQ